jgi:hypothetical protein
VSSTFLVCGILLVASLVWAVSSFRFLTNTIQAIETQLRGVPPWAVAGVVAPPSNGEILFGNNNVISSGFWHYFPSLVFSLNVEKGLRRVLLHAEYIIMTGQSGKNLDNTFFAVSRVGEVLAGFLKESWKLWRAKSRAFLPGFVNPAKKVHWKRVCPFWHDAVLRWL